LRSSDQLERELDSLIEGGYYDEDFELVWTLRRFAEALGPEELERVLDIVLGRLEHDPSVLNVLIVTAIPVPSAVPVLGSILDNQDETGTLSRSLLAALGEYADAESFHHVARLLDSDQEQEALIALARIDFPRALFHLLGSPEREHLFDVCIQIFHQRRKEAGLETLIESLQTLSSEFPVRDRVERILLFKDDHYNPFTKEQIQEILCGLCDR